MSNLYKVSAYVVYDHEQAAFCFYGGDWDGVKMIPSHYITYVEQQGDYICVVCDTRHHKETFLVYSESVEHDVEAITYLLEEFS